MAHQNNNMDPQELVPLEAGLARPRPHQPRPCNLASRSCYRAPLKLCRLLALLIVLPTVFIMVPLYMRYRVFLGQMYPMSMTDMRLIDSKISTTWCQRQVVRSNATFNAFVVPGAPELSQELVPVSMTRELELEDDMKEYWGFYLLKGSSVTVSACVSYPGASLIMIKGYKHLQECAYIGDDSSEELDELLEAYKLGLMTNTTLVEKIHELNKIDGKANDPETMRRHKAGVSFHDPKTAGNLTSSENVPTNVDVTDHDPKELREILERLHALRQAAKTESLKYYRPPDHLMSLPALHRHRDANVDKEERRWLIFKDIDGNNSEAVIKERQSINTIDIPLYKDIDLNNTLNNENSQPEINNTTVDYTEHKVMNSSSDDIEARIKSLDTNISESSKTLDTLNQENSIETVTNAETSTEKTEEVFKHNNLSNKDFIDISTRRGNEENIKISEKVKRTHNFKEKNKLEDAEDELRRNDDIGKGVFGLKEVDTGYVSSASPEPNSKEVFEDVLQRLQTLGDRGKRVLVKLHETMGLEYHEKNPSKSDIMSAVTGSGEELDRLRKVLVEAIDEEKTKSQREQKRRDSMNEARAKRELLLGQIELTKQLNEDDEARDYAAEEDAEPDGYAEHHSTVNETTALDMSNSEFWSSFSSSEEALLECDGLILNLPLTPHSGCRKDASASESFAAAKANALTYRVPANGYYFFVFNSENEVQVNFIRARFDLQKTRYDVARTKLRECTNSTDSCKLPLDIFSTQKVVLEVPLRDNDSLWNEQFVIVSECEPRTSIYLFCVIAVPILILIFAFQ